jgi:hypothetical protein
MVPTVMSCCFAAHAGKNRRGASKEICVKLKNIAKAIAAVLWFFIGIVSVAVGWGFFQGDTAVSVGGNTAKFQFAVGYTSAGAVFLLQAALTFLRKKTALILSIPVAIFTAFSVLNQLNQLVQGNMVVHKYLVVYGIIFLMAVLTTVVVLLGKKDEVPINA